MEKFKVITLTIMSFMAGIFSVKIIESIIAKSIPYILYWLALSIPVFGISIITIIYLIKKKSK